VIDADAFAALLCDWCLELAPGQQALIVGHILFPDGLVQRFAVVEPVDQCTRRDKPIAKGTRDVQQEFVKHIWDQAIA